MSRFCPSIGPHFFLHAPASDSQIFPSTRSPVRPAFGSFVDHTQARVNGCCRLNDFAVGIELDH